MKKLRISREELQERKLFIAAPMYGGQCFGHYTYAMLEFFTAMASEGFDPPQFFPLFNESAIARGRNYCAHEFMQTSRTHFLFVDADIQFSPNDALTLLTLADPQSDKDVVCGLYPKKHIAWDKVAEAVKQGKTDLEQYVGDLVFNPAGLDGTYDLYELAEVSEAGCGFMMVQRRVFEKFAEFYPLRAYKSDGRERPGLKPGKIAAYFMDEIVGERLLTEDFNFCRLVRAAGMKVWVAPWLRLNHLGYYKFIGNPEALSALVSKETN